MFEMFIFTSRLSHLELSVRLSAHLGWTGLDHSVCACVMFAFLPVAIHLDSNCVPAHFATAMHCDRCSRTLCYCAYNELKAQQVHAECEATEAISAVESAAQEAAANRRVREELVEAQQLVKAQEEEAAKFNVNTLKLRRQLWTEQQELHDQLHRAEESAAEAISAAEESAAEAHQLREEADHLMNEEQNVQKMLAIEKRYFGQERARNLEHQKIALQTRAMLVHQCWGHMENI
jgi:hypothetical protein